MTLRPAVLTDLPTIGRIQADSPQASQWEPASYLELRCMLAEEQNSIVGFLVVRQTAPDEYEILNLAVDPSARRRGVARQLLQNELAEHHGVWFLEVRESNFEAVQLYESLGFRRIGRRSGYYQNPPEPGLVMKFDS
jgi:ribosomal-protein-alanine N-acetyltransferase